MTAPVWITEQDTLAIYEHLISLHGGASGIRDRNLLKSALARPRNYFAYDQRSDIFLLATAYTGGILQNDPFADGNKRTGFVIGVLFLELNGYRYIASEEDSTRVIFSLAEGSLDELGFRSFIEDNSIPL